VHLLVCNKLRVYKMQGATIKIIEICINLRNYTALRSEVCEHQNTAVCFRVHFCRQKVIDEWGFYDTTRIFTDVQRFIVLSKRRGLLT